MLSADRICEALKEREEFHLGEEKILTERCNILCEMKIGEYPYKLTVDRVRADKLIDIIRDLKEHLDAVKKTERFLETAINEFGKVAVDMYEGNLIDSKERVK